MNKETDLLKNWELKAKGRKKEYKRYLQKVDTKKDIKRLPALHNEAFSKLIAWIVLPVVKIIRHGLKRRILNVFQKGLA